MIIFIMGPRAFGKTTTGRMLAERLKYKFIDVDEPFIKRIKKHFNGVKDFFERGENKKGDNLVEWFNIHQQELNKVLDKINKRKDYVIVLGGGALVVSKSKLSSHGITVSVQKILKNNLKRINKFDNIKVLIQLSDSIDECVKLGWVREKERFKETANFEEYSKHVSETIDDYRKIADIIITADNSNKALNKLLDKFKEFN